MTPSQFARDFLGLTLEPWQAEAIDRHYRLTAPEGQPAVDLAAEVARIRRWIDTRHPSDRPRSREELFALVKEHFREIRGAVVRDALANESVYRVSGFPSPPAGLDPLDYMTRAEATRSVPAPGVRFARDGA